MKKLIIMIVTLLCILMVGGYFVLDNLFPKASPIQIPTIDNIISISIDQSDDKSVELEKDDFDELLQYLELAKSTRKMSVNDYPSIRPYYMVVIDTSEREYRHFIYIEDGYVHIESPYEGIYKSDQQFYDLIEQYYK